MRAGLIVNPASGKNSGKGPALAEKLEGASAVPVRILERFGQLPQVLDEFAAAGVTELFVSSGDGTVQAVQTELAERKPFAQLPRLGLLPHGTTNMTAADLGFRYRSIDAQAQFLANPQPRILRRRPTLRAVNPKDGKPRHGMFLGTGAISAATLFCQQAFNARGLGGNWAGFATLAGAVARSLLTPANPADQTRFDRPYRIAIDAGGRSMAGGDQLLMLSTTLDKLILGARPFWGGAHGPIRTSVIPYPVPGILRWLLPIMYGGEDRKVPAGARSFSGTSLAIRTPVTFVIDGEFFEPPEHEPLRVETGPVFTYVCG
ncbi:MAG: diacylglycerol/lipid kinase family protein [Hyphomicrobiales bacterium]